MTKMDSKKRRLLIFAGISALSLLLVGAGKVTDSALREMQNRKTEKQQWSQAVMQMTAQLPQQHHNEWRKAAADNPQLLLEITTDRLYYKK